MKAVLANLGFFLQVSGVFMVIPFVFAFYANETFEMLAFFLTTMAFFLTGFLLNTLAEKRGLSFVDSCRLILLAYFSLGALGAIPYLLINPFGDASSLLLFSHSYFESVSGYTTTGLSLFTDVERLPSSLLVYRGLTQWVGGVGIVFLLVAFLYPEPKMGELSKVLEMRVGGIGMRRTFLIVIAFYCAYTLAGVAAFHFILGRPLVFSLSVAMAAISTGGFSPVNNLRSLAPVELVVIAVLMLLGAISFRFHLRLLGVRSNSSVEVWSLLALSLGAAVLLGTAMDWPTATFTAISALSTTGFNLGLDLAAQPSEVKALIIALMFVGGGMLSTAGGVKLTRFILLASALKWLVTGRRRPIKLVGMELGQLQLVKELSVIPITTALVYLASTYLVSWGFPFWDSALEVTSAVATAGLSTGITSLSLPLEPLWLLTLVMILGRVEVLTAFFALLPRVGVKGGWERR